MRSEAVGLVWAEARGGVIGAAGAIPWRVPGEQAVFKAVTTGHPVLMGRRTWDSLPRRPLPGRRNVVLTRDPGWRADGAEVVTDPAAFAAGWVIGGAEVYAALLPRAATAVVSRLPLEVAGDAYAPVLGADWREVHAEPVTAPDGTAYEVAVLVRGGMTDLARDARDVLRRTVRPA